MICLALWYLNLSCEIVGTHLRCIPDILFVDWNKKSSMSWHLKQYELCSCCTFRPFSLFFSQVISLAKSMFLLQRSPHCKKLSQLLSFHRNVLRRAGAKSLLRLCNVPSFDAYSSFVISCRGGG